MRDSLWKNRDHMTIDNRAGEHHDFNIGRDMHHACEPPTGEPVVAHASVAHASRKWRCHAPGLLWPRSSPRRRSGLGVAAFSKNGTVGSGLSGRISEARPTLAPPGDCASILIIDVGPRPLCGGVSIVLPDKCDCCADIDQQS